MKFVTKILEVKKALSTLVAVLVAISAVGGLPTDVKAYLAYAIAGLGAFGVTYAVANKPAV